MHAEIPLSPETLMCGEKFRLRAVFCGERGGHVRKPVFGQLRTTNLAESIRFYTTKVALTLEFQHQDLCAGIRAGNQLFHLKLSDKKDPSIEFVEKGEHFHLYLRNRQWLGCGVSVEEERGASYKGRA
jgi:hypothetical protein